MAVSYPDTPGVLRYFDTYCTSLKVKYIIFQVNMYRLARNDSTHARVKRKVVSLSTRMITI